MNLGGFKMVSGTDTYSINGYIGNKGEQKSYRIDLVRNTNILVRDSHGSDFLKNFLDSVVENNHYTDIGMVLVDFTGDVKWDKFHQSPHVKSVYGVESDIVSVIDKLSEERHARMMTITSSNESSWGSYVAKLKGTIFEHRLLDCQFLPIVVTDIDSVLETLDEEGRQDFLHTLLNIALIGKSVGMRVIIQSKDEPTFPERHFYKNLEANASVVVDVSGKEEDSFYQTVKGYFKSEEVREGKFFKVKKEQKG